MDSITDLISLVLSNVWLYGGSFLLVLSILVIVHEWGHFAVARLCGVKVEEFAVGFGRELFGYTDPRTGTRWKVCLLPIGGYVKMFGDADPAGAGKTENVAEGGDTNVVRPMTIDERKQAFFSKNVAQRAAVVVAGPAVNFIFAIMLLTGLFMTQGKEIVPPVASGVHVGSAGDIAKIQPGDRILAIDGQPIESFDDLRRHVMLALDTPMTLTIKRDDQEIAQIVTPKRLELTDRFGFTHERGYLGVLGPTNGFDIKSIAKVDGIDTGKDVDKTRALLAERIGKGPFRIVLEGGKDLDEVVVNPRADMNAEMGVEGSKKYNALILSQTEAKEYRKFGLFAGTIEAATQTWKITRESLYALWQMVTGVRSATELGGVIRIGTMAGDMANAGIIALITFTALLSINLGLINLFPIPMLDGGHLMFYGIEALRGKPVPDRIQEYAFRLGFVTLVFLMVFSNLNDVLHLILKNV